MALLTLLEVINAYMDATDGFIVSDIDDTIESQQVANIAERAFHKVTNDVFSTNLTQTLVQLDALADSTKPNYLKLPTDVQHVLESQVMYNKSTGDPGATTLNLVQITYKRPQDFLKEVGQRSTNQTNTQIVTDFSGYKMVIQNKTAPEFYTSFDDEYLVFDSFDSDVDSTLQSSKSGIIVTKQRVFTRSNTYVIDLPEWFHPTYESLVLALASEYLRGEPLITDVRDGRKGLIRARKKQRIGTKGVDTKRRSYGRR